MNSAHTNSPNEEHWYAMRVTYGRELKVQSALKGKFKTYVPKCFKMVQRFGHRRYELTSAISNLIFIYATFESLKKMKETEKAGAHLRYIKDYKDDYLVVPLKQMEDFMRVSELPEEKLIPINITDGKKLLGQKVRIIDGELAGVEGRIMRLQGNKKVVVNVSNLIAYAISFVPPEWLIKIE